jgi:Zn-dependent protease with chaperone function
VARCEGWYADGKTARQRPVQIRLEKANVTIVALDDDDRPVLDCWTVSELRRVEEESSQGPARFKQGETGAARLTIDDGDFLDALRAAAPRLSPRSGWRRWMAAISVGGAATLFIVFALPLFSAWLAPLVPESWEKKVGEQTMAALLEAFGENARFCDGEEGRDALRHLVVRLIERSGENADYRVRVSSHEKINAFALLGGEVVLFRGLIDFAVTPEEVAGVVAHELGHLIYRHPTQAMIRGLGIDLVLDLMTGNSTLGGLGHSMLRLSYSREAEREADVIALELLAGAGIRRDGMVDFFRRLDEKKGGFPEALQFLSSHPPSRERIARAQRGAPGGDAMTPEAWRALRRICD